MNFQWHIRSWEDISKNELYELLALRIRVFVIEQNCPYQDADGKDKNSLHLFATDDSEKCIACLRIVKPGVSYDEWSIGRVATDESIRKEGMGKMLMRQAMNYLKDHGNPAIRISAQSYLLKFYSEFGFVKVSEEYLEDNIPHFEMLYLP